MIWLFFFEENYLTALFQVAELEEEEDQMKSELWSEANVYDDVKESREMKEAQQKRAGPMNAAGVEDDEVIISK